MRAFKLSGVHSRIARVYVTEMNNFHGTICIRKKDIQTYLQTFLAGDTVDHDQRTL
jgi:phosphotransferase system HPr-like phosphotransfer protein